MRVLVVYGTKRAGTERIQRIPRTPVNLPRGGPAMRVGG
jgi:hypothetical protein